MIATREVLTAYYYVGHPILDAKIRQKLALTYMCPVSLQVRDLVNQERLRLYLSLDEEYPLSEYDHAIMADTVEIMNDR